MSIEVNHLRVGYDDHIVIPDMNLVIPQGKMSMIIGSNGCGKSTLLKSIGRIIKPVSGEITIDGKTMKKMAPKELARKMAILPQSPVVPQRITVKELVTFGRFPYQKPFAGLGKEDQEIINWAMKETGVLELKDREVDQLSGGQRQRVWIAMTLAQKTDILILDEPTTYLDMAHQLEVLSLLREINRKNHTTIIIVIHELNLAAKFADHLIGMNQGKLIFEGKPLDVVTKENLYQLYRIDADIRVSANGAYPVCMDFEMADIQVDNQVDDQVDDPLVDDQLEDKRLAGCDEEE